VYLVTAGVEPGAGGDVASVVADAHAEDAAVERRRGVEVGDLDRDVVDSFDLHAIVRDAAATTAACRPAR
jgi:hypothetical protein